MDKLDDADLDKVRAIIKDAGELIFAQRSGSWSFNLSLPTSDKDYFGVFVAPDPLHIPANSFDHTVHGTDDDWVVYELGKYIELVLKGNPKVVEPLFATHFTYTTPTWERVAQFLRPLVINRNTVAQYTSFASFEMKDALGKKAKAEAAIRKAHATKNGSASNSSNQTTASAEQADSEELTKELAAITLATHGKPFYHGLRLAREAMRIQKGLAPKVWMEGEDREELMAIRTGKCKKSFEEVAAQVKSEIDAVRALGRSNSSNDTSSETFSSQSPETISLGANRTGECVSTIPESIDEKIVGQWLVDFRMPMLKEIANKESRRAHTDSTTASSSVESSTVSASSRPSAEFEAVIERAHALLKSNAFEDARVVYVAPMGTELLRRLANPTSSAMDPSADYLVVYRLPVAKILNTTIEVPRVIYEKPNGKVGQGIWLVEIVDARDGFSRHHALFESTVLLQHEVSRFANPIYWQDETWEPFGKLFAEGFAKREFPSFGLLSHYLGVITGLLRSTEVWKTEKSSKGESKVGGIEEKSKAETSGLEDLGAKLKSLYLSKRLLAQVELLLSRQSADSPALLGSEEANKLLRMRGESCHPANLGAVRSDEEKEDFAADSDGIVKSEVEAESVRLSLLESALTLQTKLKTLKLPTALSKDFKKLLEREIRQVRFDTI